MKELKKYQNFRRLYVESVDAARRLQFDTKGLAIQVFRFDDDELAIPIKVM